jgi:hypothetical protein
MPVEKSNNTFYPLKLLQLTCLFSLSNKEKAGACIPISIFIKPVLFLSYLMK